MALISLLGVPMVVGCGARMAGGDNERRALTSAETEVGGLAFAMTTRARWPVPRRADPMGGEVPLELHVINRGPADVRLLLLDTVRVRVSTSDGRELALDGGRDATRPADTASPPIPPAGRFAIPRPARLLWLADGVRLRLQGDDGFGGLWYVDGLVPGARYRVQMTHENRETGRGALRGLWTGAATTPAVEVTIGGG